MFGIFLAVACSGLDELASSIGKYEIRHRVGSVYTLGFLTIFFGTIFFLATGFLRDSFVFSLASLPTFVPRVILETLQIHLTLLALVRAERGDFSFLRLLTIPLLLLIDITLGYAFSTTQLVGMGIIGAVIVLLVALERPKFRIVKQLLLVAILGAITISLYKYNITHFNSVEAEQSIIGLCIALYFFVMAVMKRGENPFVLLRIRGYAIQSTASALSEVIASFAYLFAPAALITAALRSSAILFAILSGRRYFHERHLLVRLILFVLISGAIVLLAFG